MKINVSELKQLKNLREIINSMYIKDKWKLKYGNKLFSKGWVSISPLKYRKLFIFYKYNNAFYLWNRIHKQYDHKVYSFKEMNQLILELIQIMINSKRKEM